MAVTITLRVEVFLLYREGSKGVTFGKYKRFINGKVMFPEKEALAFTFLINHEVDLFLQIS